MTDQNNITFFSVQSDGVYSMDKSTNQISKVKEFDNFADAFKHQQVIPVNICIVDEVKPVDKSKRLDDLKNLIIHQLKATSFLKNGISMIYSYDACEIINRVMSEHKCISLYGVIQDKMYSLRSMRGKASHSCMISVKDALEVLDKLVPDIKFKLDAKKHTEKSRNAIIEQLTKESFIHNDIRCIPTSKVHEILTDKLCNPESPLSSESSFISYITIFEKTQRISFVHKIYCSTVTLENAIKVVNELMGFDGTQTCDEMQSNPKRTKRCKRSDMIDTVELGLFRPDKNGNPGLKMPECLLEPKTKPTGRVYNTGIVYNVDQLRMPSILKEYVDITPVDIIDELDPSTREMINRLCDNMEKLKSSEKAQTLATEEKNVPMKNEDGKPIECASPTKNYTELVLNEKSVYRDFEHIDELDDTQKELHKVASVEDIADQSANIIPDNDPNVSIGYASPGSIGYQSICIGVDCCPHRNKRGDIDPNDSIVPSIIPKEEWKRRALLRRWQQTRLRGKDFNNCKEYKWLDCDEKYMDNFLSQLNAAYPTLDETSATRFSVDKYSDAYYENIDKETKLLFDEWCKRKENQVSITDAVDDDALSKTAKEVVIALKNGGKEIGFFDKEIGVQPHEIVDHKLELFLDQRVPFNESSQDFLNLPPKKVAVLEALEKNAKETIDLKNGAKEITFFDKQVAEPREPKKLVARVI